MGMTIPESREDKNKMRVLLNSLMEFGKVYKKINISKMALNPPNNFNKNRYSIELRFLIAAGYITKIGWATEAGDGYDRIIRVETIPPISGAAVEAVEKVIEKVKSKSEPVKKPRSKSRAALQDIAKYFGANVEGENLTSFYDMAKSFQCEDYSFLTLLNMVRMCIIKKYMVYTGEYMEPTTIAIIKKLDFDEICVKNYTEIVKTHEHYKSGEDKNRNYPKKPVQPEEKSNSEEYKISVLVALERINDTMLRVEAALNGGNQAAQQNQQMEIQETSVRLDKIRLYNKELDEAEKKIAHVLELRSELDM